jgi:hypothetical protein
VKKHPLVGESVFQTLGEVLDFGMDWLEFANGFDEYLMIYIYIYILLSESND